MPELYHTYDIKTRENYQSVGKKANIHSFCIFYKILILETPIVDISLPSFTKSFNINLFKIIFDFIFFNF